MIITLQRKLNLRYYFSLNDLGFYRTSAETNSNFLLHTSYTSMNFSVCTSKKKFIHKVRCQLFIEKYVFDRRHSFNIVFIYLFAITTLTIVEPASKANKIFLLTPSIHLSIYAAWCQYAKVSQVNERTMHFYFFKRPTGHTMLYPASSAYPCIHQSVIYTRLLV